MRILVSVAFGVIAVLSSGARWRTGDLWCGDLRGYADVVTTQAEKTITACSGAVQVEGTLWLPHAGRGQPVALLTMHPGSGPSDRDNDNFFPPIRERLLNAGVAVASFDKRGVGNSSGSWLDIGIEEQAADLLAGHAAAAALVPGVPAGIFGHSQGGWVVLEALRASRDAGFVGARPAFGVTSSGPGVTTADQERFAALNAVTRITPDATVQERALRAAWTVIGMFEAGRAHGQLIAWANEPRNSHDVELVKRLYGDDLLDARMWDHLVRLAAFDPIPAMEAVAVPLLAVFGSRDTVTPVEPSAAAFTAHVAPELLQIAVLPEGNHRLQMPDSTNFVPGYPEVIVGFVAALTV